MVEEWQRFKNFVGDMDISNIVKFAITDRVEKLLSLQKIRTLEEVEKLSKEMRQDFLKTLGLEIVRYEEVFDWFDDSFTNLLAKLTSLKQDSGEIKK